MLAYRAEDTHLTRLISTDISIFVISRGLDSPLPPNTELSVLLFPFCSWHGASLPASLEIVEKLSVKLSSILEMSPHYVRNLAAIIFCRSFYYIIERYNDVSCDIHWIKIVSSIERCSRLSCRYHATLYFLRHPLRLLAVPSLSLDRNSPRRWSKLASLADQPNETR